MAKLVDPRRWVNFHARGLARILIHLQAAVEDVEGTLAAGQLHEAAYCLRLALLHYLSILGLNKGADSIDFSSEFDYINFDPISDVDAAIAREVLSAAQSAFGAVTHDQKLAIVADLKEKVRELEQMLSVQDPKLLRSPEGPMLFIRFVRDWERLLAALGLPSALSGYWKGA
ncbi:hypothetical protein V1294_006821 [Bradyrhizobium sp. AZCC 1678]|uniref:hypothetical protein n=1 Tax=Bradyrhizobium sp. AZCC 1678 TaxID=3117030 RepID=UPI002FEE9822